MGGPEPGATVVRHGIFNMGAARWFSIEKIYLNAVFCPSNRVCSAYIIGIMERKVIMGSCGDPFNDMPYPASPDALHPVSRKIIKQKNAINEFVMATLNELVILSQAQAELEKAMSEKYNLPPGVNLSSNVNATIVLEKDNKTYEVLHHKGMTADDIVRIAWDQFGDSKKAPPSKKDPVKRPLPDLTKMFSENYVPPEGQPSPSKP